MSGRHNFRKLQAQSDADPVPRTRVQRERELTETIIRLTALREARGATQQQIADAWDATQSNVSQIEHTPDVFLSTLRNYVEALGGRLEINAVFPDQTITLLPAGVESADHAARDEPNTPGAALTG